LNQLSQSNQTDLKNSNTLINFALDYLNEDFLYFKSIRENVENLFFGNKKSCPLSDLFLNKDQTFCIEMNFEDNLTNLFHYDFHLKNEFKDQLDIQYNKENNYQFNLSTQTDLSEWNQMLLDAQALFNENKFEKIVLKKNKTFNIKNNQIDFLKKLIAHNFENYIVLKKEANQYFISFTPETLLKKNNDVICTMALAGSRFKSTHLLSEDKLTEENEIVFRSINKIMKQFCHETNFSDKKEMTLKYIKHLLIEISGKIKDQNSIFELINQLHPTPAVGGFPKKEIIENINKIEKGKRNHYAAPFGMINYNDADVAVAIRSGYLENDLLTIFAGAGITKDSISIQEWDETELKMAPFLKEIQNEIVT